MSGRHDTITCPECQRETRISSGNLDALICPQIFESTVYLMCWPLNSVILLKPDVETVTRRAHTVSTASSVVFSGVKTVLFIITA